MFKKYLTKQISKQTYIMFDLCSMLTSVLCLLSRCLFMAATIWYNVLEGYLQPANNDVDKMLDIANFNPLPSFQLYVFNPEILLILQDKGAFNK